MGDLLAELDAAAQARRQQRQAERGAAPATPELEAKRAAEAANWESLRANPEAWFDNRNNKQVGGRMEVVATAGRHAARQRSGNTGTAEPEDTWAPVPSFQLLNL